MMSRLLGLTLCVLALAGCNGSGQGKLPLAGSVELDGLPLATGDILFTSVSGAVATASIVDGKFAIPADRSVPAGTYGVQITGYEKTGKMIPDSDAPGQMVEETKSIVPAKYNMASELTQDITADNASSLEFRLSSDGE
ncbi:hypothetical protein [Aeoliella mucimassa]|uniref:Carboxypeptidase regulatory-like domain-containing protein n=1 Tax=Aeoliella mucimassa TaxID=2527972 RepID=A0A518AQ54_9BACT|nr:hypothetical protein [Aeoliella mucimassa]QDU56860.1 hypothetical protein Pan181_30720 [Aeoliella mucimassa]